MKERTDVTYINIACFFNEIQDFYQWKWNFTKFDINVNPFIVIFVNNAVMPCGNTNVYFWYLLIMIQLFNFSYIKSLQTRILLGSQTSLNRKKLGWRKHEHAYMNHRACDLDLNVHTVTQYFKTKRSVAESALTHQILLLF